MEGDWQLILNQTCRSAVAPQRLNESLVSTYVVCERLSVMHRQARLPEIFDQIAQNTLFWNLVQNPPPPLENLNLDRSWHFGFWLSRTHHPQLKFGQILALWVLTFQNTPPPQIEIWTDLGTLGFDFPEHPPPLKNWNLDRSWHFEFWLSRTLPENWNWARSWHFGFWLSRTPPPPNWNLDRSWHFGFWPPPPENCNLDRSWHFGFWWLEYVETNPCIPQGYHLVQ